MHPYPAPLGNTPHDAARIVRAEIERALPPGWRVTGLDDNRPLFGFIAPVGARGGERDGYGVRISGGLDFLVFTYGNNDIGPLTIDQAIERALVVYAIVLRQFGMGACLRHLLSFKPNAFGYT